MFKFGAINFGPWCMSGSCCYLYLVVSRSLSVAIMMFVSNSFLKLVQYVWLYLCQGSVFKSVACAIIVTMIVIRSLVDIGYCSVRNLYWASWLLRTMASVVTELGLMMVEDQGPHG